MILRVGLKLLMFLCCVNLCAQTERDFGMMLQNGLKKNHQNPESGLRVLKTINIKNLDIVTQFSVQEAMMESYLLQSNFTSAVAVVSEGTGDLTLENDEAQFLQDLSIIELFQKLNLYQQSEVLLSKVRKNLRFNKGSLDDFNGWAARLDYLEAVQYFHDKKYLKSFDHLVSSSKMVLGSRTYSSRVLLLKNKLLEAKIEMAQKDFTKAESCLLSVTDMLQFFPDEIYFKVSQSILSAEVLILKGNYLGANQILLESKKEISGKNFKGLEFELNTMLSSNFLVLKDSNGFKGVQKELSQQQDYLQQDSNLARRSLIEFYQNVQKENLKLLDIQYQRFIYYLGGFCGLVLVLLLIFVYQEKLKGKALEKQIEFAKAHRQVIIVEEKIVEEQLKKQLVIPKETEDEILIKLQDFEVSEGFLDSSISLAALAGQLGTNTKYLSEIINKFKEKSFTSYINELRISYIAKKISSDPKYQQYKISYLAELAGFTNHSTFSVVFKSVTGVTPNKFIQQFSKDQQ